MSPVGVEELIEVIQEALVDAEGRGDAPVDDVEREAFAHDVATRHLADRARRAVEQGDAPLDPAAEADVVAKAIAGYFGSPKCSQRE